MARRDKFGFLKGVEVDPLLIEVPSGLDAKPRVTLAVRPMDIDMQTVARDIAQVQHLKTEVKILEAILWAACANGGLIVDERALLAHTPDQKVETTFNSQTREYTIRRRNG
jgi:hypothetical protein